MFVITVILCFFGNAGAEQQAESEKTKPGYELTVYPQEIHFGDPVYIGIRLKNTSDKPLSYVTTGYQRRNFWLTLLADDISAPYHLLHEGVYTHEFHQTFPTPARVFLPGESMLVFVAYQEIPALEDMNFPFWEEVKKRLKTDGYFVAHVGIENPNHGNRRSEPDYDSLSAPVLVKPRPASEMELLERWFEETPARLRPVPFDQMAREGNYLDAVFDLKDEFDAIPLSPSPDFVSKERYLKINRNDRLDFASNEHFIKVQNQDFIPYLFLRHANRKPGDPVCPETWQGWKELEESLTPGTMRDEIRLTRILIQYCDTKDEKVPDELREWFAGMNEIQRTCMAKSVCDRARACYGNDALFPPFRELYKAIRKYDTVAKSESETESLKKSDLLE